MNVGDKVSVLIGGSEVAQAEVKEVGDGTATLIVPATRVVMAVRTELAPEVTLDAAGGTQTIVDEVVRTPEGAVELPLKPAENAGGVVGAEQIDGTLSQDSVVAAAGTDKVISSSSVPTPNNSAAALSPEVLAQIAAAVVAAQATTQEAPSESTEASGEE